MKAKFILIFFAFFILGNTLHSEPRRVIIEYCTGTWCGWCPCGHHVIDSLIMPDYPNTISIAYHGGGANDPFINFENNYIMNQLGFTAYPTAVIDRTNSPNNPSKVYSMWYQMAESRYSSSPTTRVNIEIVNKFFNPSTRELSATLNAVALENMQGTYRVQFMLLENNIIYKQFFGSGCGTYGYHFDYVHNHIARCLMTSSIGEILCSSQWNQNQIITRSFTKVLESTWIPENMELVAFVFKDSSEVYNGTIEQAIKTEVTGLTSVENENNEPEGFYLSQNYPNPFNPATHIIFSVPVDQFVTLKFYNSLGQEILTLVNNYLNAGTYNAEFDGKDLPSGIYYYSLITEKFAETKKMMLIK